MKKLHRVTGILAIALGLAILASLTQRMNAQGAAVPAASSGGSGRVEVGMNFTYKFAQIADPATTRFMMPGISVDAAYSLDKKLHNFALAGEINGERVENIVPGVNLQQVSIVGGPRYTVHLATSSSHPIEVYGQVFGGYLFATDSIFPAPVSAINNARSSVFQTGGGVNLRLSRVISLRLVEGDFVMTHLPNNASNLQYDVRLSNGIVFHY